MGSYNGAPLLPLAIALAAIPAFLAQAQTYSVVYNSAGASDGRLPYAPVVCEQHCNLYGTTFYGGLFDSGTVYKVDSTGTESILYNFSGAAHGSLPYADLRVASGASHINRLYRTL